MDKSHSRDSRPVILADDGAPASDVAWAWVTSHDWSGWPLTILTVRDTLVPGGPTIRGDVARVPRRPPAEAAFSEVVHLDLDGDPRSVLLGYAESPLLVVGSHRRGHLAGLLAGSTTEWLLVRPPAPLAIVLHGHQTRTAAVFVDGSTHAQYTLERFLALPWAGNVEVTLVAVDDGRTEVEGALAAARAAFPAGSQPAEIRLTGKPRREIPALVRSSRVDLAVLGTRGLTGLARMTAGSTVSALVKDATANLLVAHGEDRSAASPT
jgi:nucleotide-binding universal stress UspA family protein